MGVPTDENTDFKVFGSSDNTTIAGAINQGAQASATNSSTKFTQLIAASSTSKFDPIYAGQIITNLNQVTCAEQYRGYPALSSSASGASNFGSGNLIGHFGTTGYQTLTWRVFLDIAGYSNKTVTIGPNTSCLFGCGYTSAARRNTSETITGSGSITVTRMADSSSNSNNQVNDDGDVQLVITEGTSNSPRPGISSSGSPNRYDLTNGTYRRANYTFTAGQTFSKTFVFTNLFVADGDTFQLDITEG
tara:strand:+ start:564 stop:1304 length:741 start_codon:yes stop_codon:yes gene_type:complete